ncbi:MAG TPA: hypothetical protein VF754_08795 [Pyrinomonadaceae bacterium]
MKATLDNVLIVLIGFAGTGKYTVGRELCRRTGAKLIDNQLINNPVFMAVDADGVRPLPPAVWGKVSVIRAAVYETIREISPPGLSFVFTLELLEDDPASVQAFRDLEELARLRGGLFVPVRLVCEVEELCRRVTEPSRVERLKDISPERARRKSAVRIVLNPEHANLRTIDVTEQPPSETVDEILREIELMRSEPLRGK